MPSAAGDTALLAVGGKRILRSKWAGAYPEDLCREWAQFLRATFEVKTNPLSTPGSSPNGHLPVPTTTGLRPRFCTPWALVMLLKPLHMCSGSSVTHFVHSLFLGHFDQSLTPVQRELCDPFRT